MMKTMPMSLKNFMLLTICNKTLQFKSQENARKRLCFIFFQVKISRILAEFEKKLAEWDPEKHNLKARLAESAEK